MVYPYSDAHEFVWQAAQALKDADTLLNAFNFTKTQGIPHRDFKEDGDKHALMLVKKALRLLKNAEEFLELK